MESELFFLLSSGVRLGDEALFDWENSGNSMSRRSLLGGTQSSSANSAAAAAAAAAAQSSLQDAQNLKWKLAMWTKDTTEPAILRVPIAIIFFIFLWAGNVWVLDKMGIAYHGVLSIKSNPLAFSLVVACLLTVTYALTMTLFSNMMGLPVESGIGIFYFLLVASQVLLPSAMPGQETKASFFRLCRTIIFPGSTISFPEVLLADALCSLSKVFKDVGVSVIVMYASLSGKSVVDLHEEGMLLCAVLASVPFAIRVRQCWVQLDGCKDSIGKVPITLNIIKYISSFPPIWLAAAASLGYFHPALPSITAAMATINSLYSYLWDVIQDWGLLQFSRDGRVYGRQKYMFPMLAYAIACVINLVIRFSWAANRIPYFATFHASHLVLMVELAEVARRAMWNFFRIEWEMLVQEIRTSNQNLFILGQDKP